MTSLRILPVVLSLPLLLSACGGGDFEVRNGPQAVHPSPSPLAQNIVTATPCGEGHADCITTHHTYHHSGNDGSQPIVD